MIQAGELRDVITIQRPVEMQDTYGQESTGFENMYSNMRADVHPISGREYASYRQVAVDINTRIKIRRVPNVTEKCRVVRVITEDSPPTVEVYDITAVLPDLVSGMRYLTLLCVRRFAEGFRRGE